MKSTPFVPDGLVITESVKTDLFLLEKLTVSHVELDYHAVMSSIDIIKKTRGGTSWPFPEMTLEQDKLDLAWHQTEFELRCSFAYTILYLDKSKCLGCVYIYPPSKPWLNYPEGSDAIVNFWVTQEAYNNGLYPKVFLFLKYWIYKNWPFKQVYYSNIKKVE